MPRRVEGGTGSERLEHHREARNPWRQRGKPAQWSRRTSVPNR